MVDLDPRFFPADPQFLMLDVGPGAGGVLEAYAQDRRVVAVELEEALAREVAKRTSPWQLSSCRGNAEQLPLRGESVDGVIAIEMLEHVNDPDQVLAEAYRVLRPNGALCVAVPTSYTERFYSRVHPRYMSNATHVRIFKKKDLLRRMANQGFVTERPRPEHLVPMLAWVVHSFLHTEADPTGWVLEHHGVDPKVERGVARVHRVPLAGRVVPWAQRHLGKSWYIYARKPGT